MVTMKLCLVSDLHGHLPELPLSDLILLGGDICPDGNIFTQVAWLNDIFRKWLAAQRAPVVGVAGNHDFVFQDASHLVPRLPWTYLRDSETTVAGFKIYGSPWQPRFFDWAFNLDEPELAEKWAHIPDDIDILLLHGPPLGYGDNAPRMDRGERTEVHVGSPSLLERVKQTKPRLVVFGHIHPGYGVYQLGETVLVNASLVNDKYQPVNAPVLVELEPLDRALAE